MTPRVALVSGAASGIGRAIAAELTARGWSVVGLDLAPAPDCAASFEVDVTDGEAVAQAVSRARDSFGPISAAVSAAGHYAMRPVSDISRDEWHRMLRVHLGGLVAISRAVLPEMIDQGEGALVAITSELALGGGDTDSHYAAAKGAVIGFVRSLAAEVAPSGVRVNAVAPGPTDTPLLAQDSPWRAPDYLSTLPIGRLVHPDEVALCVAGVIEDLSFCVGEIISPNAGAVI